MNKRQQTKMLKNCLVTLGATEIAAIVANYRLNKPVKLIVKRLRANAGLLRSVSGDCLVRVTKHRVIVTNFKDSQIVAQTIFTTKQIINDNRTKQIINNCCKYMTISKADDNNG